MVRAAIALRLARPAGTPSSLFPASGAATSLSLARWRSRYPKAFERTCTALIEADSLSARSAGPAGGQLSALISTANVLLPVALGAILTLLITGWTSSRDRRRVEAAGIRSSFTAFLQALADYTRRWSAATVTAQPSIDAVDQRRRDVVATIRRAAALYGKSTFAEPLIRDLDSEKYRADLESGWANSDRPSRQRRAQVIEQLVLALQTDEESLAREIERSVLRSEGPRSPFPASVSHQTS